MAPRLGGACHGAALKAIYCFLTPENGRLRTTEFQALFSTSFPSECPRGPTHSLNLSSLKASGSLRHVVCSELSGFDSRALEGTYV